MNFALLAPVALAALAALALPLLIHLARRTEERPVDFAAIRWLRHRPRPRKRPRLDEHLLLAVRLLLLAVLALWLARPVLTGAAARTPWVAVVPGVDPARAAALVAGGAQAAWLAPGFPALDTPAPAGAVPVASLLRELDANLPPGVPLTVLVPPVIAPADAERPRVARRVTWQIVPGRVAAPALPARAPFAVAIRVAPGVEGVRFLRAAATALLPPDRPLDIAPASAALPKAGAVVWWQGGDIPAGVRERAAHGGAVVVPAAAVLPPGPVAVVWRDAEGAPLAEAAVVGRGRIVRFTRPLEPAAMPVLLDASFPDAFAALIAGPPPPPARVRAVDYAPEPGARTGTAITAPRDLQPWFAVLLATLFLVERWLATRRERAPAP